MQLYTTPPTPKKRTLCPPVSTFLKHHKNYMNFNDEVQWRLWNRNSTKCNCVLICLMGGGGDVLIPTFVHLNSPNCYSMNYVWGMIEQVTKFTTSIKRSNWLTKLRQLLSNFGAILRPLWLLKVASLIKLFLHYCNLSVTYLFFQ